MSRSGRPGKPGTRRFGPASLLWPALLCLAAAIAVAFFGPPLPTSQETGDGRQQNSAEAARAAAASKGSGITTGVAPRPPSAQPVARRDAGDEQIGDPEPTGPVKTRPRGERHPGQDGPRGGPPEGLGEPLGKPLANPGAEWEGAVVEPGGAVGHDPLGTGAEIGQLSPTERARVETAAERFVKVAYGAWGRSPSQGDYYRQAVAGVVADLDRFYASPAGDDLREMARLIEGPGVYATAEVKKFTALTESPEKVRVRVGIRINRMIDGPVYGKQELVLVPAAAGEGDGPGVGWKVSEATSGAPAPTPARPPSGPMARPAPDGGAAPARASEEGR